MDNIEIISLNPKNWKQFKELRLRALKEEPQAFGSTNKNTQWLVFAKLNGNLVGSVIDSIINDL